MPRVLLSAVFLLLVTPVHTPANHPVKLIVEDAPIIKEAIS